MLRALTSAAQHPQTLNQFQFLISLGRSPQVLTGEYSPKEAYDAVTQLHERGEACVQNIRKRAREATSAAAKKKTNERPAKAKKKKARLLPKGTRLRSDQVDALAMVKEGRLN
jgi:hypothetical protein